MNEKECNICKETLPLDSFPKSKNVKSGRVGHCKKCRQVMSKRTPSNTWGTLQYFKHDTWKAMNRRTVNGSHPGTDASSKRYLQKGIRLELTKSEFNKWCDDHVQEILGLYQKNLTPSIDRKDPLKHYSLNNIQITERFENVLKGARNANKLKCKPVVATKSGSVLKFSSSIEAATHGFSASNIRKCAGGFTKTYRGYVWKYV